jgi:hypothetical protein
LLGCRCGLSRFSNEQRFWDDSEGRFNLVAENARERDLDKLKNLAFEQETEQNFEKALELWTRINIAAQGADTQFYRAFERIQKKRRGEETRRQYLAPERIEAKQQEEQVQERLEFEERQREEKERLDGEESQHKEENRLKAEQREKERLEAEQREKQRLETERLEKERLEAECRETEKKKRLEPARRQKEERILTLKQWRLRLAKRFSFVPFALALLTYFLVYWSSGRQLGNAIPESGIAILTDCLQHLDTFRWTIYLMFVLASLCNIFMIVSCFLNYRRKAILEAMISSSAAILFVAIWCLGSWGSADGRPEIGLHLACVLLTAGALVKAVLLKNERLEAALRQVNVGEAVDNSDHVLTLQPGRLRLMKKFAFVPFVLVLPTYFLVYWYYPDHPGMRCERSGIAFLTECGSIWEITDNSTFVLANLCNIFMLVSCFIQYRRKAILEAILSSSAAIVFVTLWSLGSAGRVLASSAGLELRPGIGLILACVFLAVGALVKTAILSNPARHQRPTQQPSIGIGGRT